jgi:BolA protein
MSLSLIKQSLLDYFGSACQIHLEDQSSLHLGHKGMDGHGGGHYQLLIVSNKFAGLSRVHRHKLVYDVLNSYFKNKIHALSITTLTFDEYEKK